MPIPTLTADGFLPEGVHDCTLVEIGERFGQFQRSDRRCRLFDRLAEYIQDAQTSGVVNAVIVNGSFVTGKDVPSDIDLIVVSLPKGLLPASLRQSPKPTAAAPYADRRRNWRRRIPAGSRGCIFMFTTPHTSTTDLRVS